MAETIIDLIDAYGYRNIEGVDKLDILCCVTSNSNSDWELVPNEVRTIRNKNSDIKVAFKCVGEYFEPVKEYYRYNKNDSCELIRSGLGISNDEGCLNCLQTCIVNGLKIKPKKISLKKRANVL